MNQHLKVSVITVCLNCEQTINKTIESVISQTYGNIEYIIVDGGSTDNTLNIINMYGQKISRKISENDSGIYDAMNKGLKLSSGDVIIFLNSGDLFFENKTIEKAINALLINNNFDGIYGDSIFFSDKGSTYIQAPKLSLWDLIRCGGICHQSMLISKKTYDRIGEFDLKYVICSDYDWLLKSYSRKANFLYLNMPICYYLKGGFSEINYNTFLKELISISIKHLNLYLILSNMILDPFGFLLLLKTFTYFVYKKFWDSCIRHQHLLKF